MTQKITRVVGQGEAIGESDILGYPLFPVPSGSASARALPRNGLNGPAQVGRCSDFFPLPHHSNMSIRCSPL